MSGTDTQPEAKRAVLTEGLRLFATRGVECVSVRDIARATGFSNPALFRHFKSKEALAYHLFETAYRDLAAALLEIGEVPGLRDWLAAALRAIVRSPDAVHFVVENLARYWADLPDALKAQNLPSLVRLRLEAEVRAGSLRADLNIPLARTVVLGTLAQIARSTLFSGTSIEPEILADEIHDLLVRGLGSVWEPKT